MIWDFGVRISGFRDQSEFPGFASKPLCLFVGLRLGFFTETAYATKRLKNMGGFFLFLASEDPSPSTPQP